MPDLSMIESLNAQLQSMRSLLVSEEWVQWTNFLKRERRGYLQNKANSLLREGKYEEARIALALMDDCVKMIEIFGRSISDTENKLKGVRNGN